MTTTKKTLRTTLRKVRARLPRSERRRKSAAAAQRLARTFRFRRARVVAVYFAANDEADPAPVVRLARRLGKTCCLPILHPFRHGKLMFAVWQPRARLQPNRFGIPEPAPHRRMVSPRRLDMVIVPLLGFDACGTRLGMGGGFYDRTFAFRQRCPAWNRPWLVGYAYSCQHVKTLPREAWDMQLDWVVTETTLLATGWHGTT
jgi:5-formyltetrahydrofolate cyclo-ligase